MDDFSYDIAFSRNIGVLTPEAQELLQKSCIAIAGVGGVGGTTAEQLARMGAGYLKIADNDTFSITNINRQAGCSVATLGKNKTEVLDEYLKTINPSIKIDTFPSGAKEENLSEFLENADIILDLVDYFSPSARLAIHRKAREAKKYVLSTPATGFGAAILCFSPEGPTIEDFLGFPKDPEKAKSHMMDPEKLMGCNLEYLPDIYWKTPKSPAPYVSTVSPSVAIAGCLTATQSLKVLMYDEQQKDFMKFREYGRIELVKVPQVMRIDAWGTQHCCTIDFSEKR
jgi:molybdopterin/thiamine biosynthesis adenylyltransferase